jgi:membrane peptidoglycan carboxypeptidase
MSAPLLSVQGVETYYGKIVALRGVDVEVNPGEIVTLIGANGAGKSTLMRTVAGILPPSSGRVEVNGRVSTLLSLGVGFNRRLTGRENRILVGAGQISPSVQRAVIAMEDQRFYQHSGIDPRGIARALVADLTRRRAVQGASTITQQFVKNALATQTKRTVFQKLREAALAYHLTRKWSKRKILTEYLNSVYFGNGAYGVESAARVYFSYFHPGCGQVIRIAGKDAHF